MPQSSRSSCSLRPNNPMLPLAWLGSVSLVYCWAVTASVGGRQAPTNRVGDDFAEPGWWAVLTSPSSLYPLPN